MTIRVERNSPPPHLPNIVTSFVIEYLGGKSLDDNFNEEAKQGKFPDFSCFNGVLLIEMKNLETPQDQRISKVIEDNINKDDKLQFYGSRDFDKSVNNSPETQALKQKLFNRLSRTVEGALRQAKKQFEGYESRNPKKNRVKLCLLLNSKIQEFTPEVVLKSISRKMSERSSEWEKYKSIDAIVYISLKHFKTTNNGKIAYPISIFTGMSAEQHYWKEAILDLFCNKWANFNGIRHINSTDDFSNFETVQDIPQKISRSEYWILEYERDPYLSDVHLDELRLRFNYLVFQLQTSFVKGNWEKPAKETTQTNLRKFAHINTEINRRGLDIREMHHTLLTQDQKHMLTRGLPEELQGQILQ